MRAYRTLGSKLARAESSRAGRRLAPKSGGEQTNLGRPDELLTCPGTPTTPQLSTRSSMSGKSAAWRYCDILMAIRDELRRGLTP